MAKSPPPAPKIVAPPAPPAPPAPAAAAPPAPPAPPAPAAASAFKYDDNLPIPAGRTFGGAGEVSETTLAITGLPVGKSYLAEVTVAAEITDPKARTEDFNAQCKTLTNRVGGAIRRIRKDHAEQNYTIRKVADTTLGYGIRVWRDADTVA